MIRGLGRRLIVRAAPRQSQACGSGRRRYPDRSPERRSACGGCRPARAFWGREAVASFPTPTRAALLAATYARGRGSFYRPGGAVVRARHDDPRSRRLPRASCSRCIPRSPSLLRRSSPQLLEAKLERPERPELLRPVPQRDRSERNLMSRRDQPLPFRAGSVGSSLPLVSRHLLLIRPGAVVRRRFWDSSGTHAAFQKNRNPRFTGALEADDGTRTHDLLHGKQTL